MSGRAESNILSVLKSNRLRVRLVQFAQTKFMDEAPRFWIAVHEYAKNPSLDKARVLEKTFLEPGAEQEVALSFKERQKVQHDLKLGLLPDFGSLVHEAESLMQNHLFKEFEAAVLSVQKQWSSGASLSESSGGTDESPARRQTHELLINMLLDRKNHALLCRLLIADPNTIEIVSELLLLDDEDPLIDLFRFVVQEEISRTADSNTLFREQSLAVQLFGELVKRPPVRRWLVSVLRKPVLRAGIAMGGPIKTAASVLSALCKKAFLIPPVLSRVLMCVSECASTRFPSMRHAVVASFVLLRACGPLLVSPCPVLLPDPPKYQPVLTSTVRLLMAKASTDSAFVGKDFDSEELLFLRSQPSVEEVMQRLLEGGGGGAGGASAESSVEESKALRVLGGRSRSGSVSGPLPQINPSSRTSAISPEKSSASHAMPPPPLGSRSRSGSVSSSTPNLLDLPSASSSSLLSLAPSFPLQGRSRSSSVAGIDELIPSSAAIRRGSGGVGATSSPSGSPRSHGGGGSAKTTPVVVRGRSMTVSAEGEVSMLRRGSFSAGLSTIRALFASPTSSPRDPTTTALTLQERLQIVSEREDAIVGLRQIIVDSLLKNWATIKATLSNEGLAETVTFQWFESKFNALGE